MNKIIWKINFPTLMLMLADSPRYVQGEKNKYVPIETEEQLNALITKKYEK